jgi:hypothetical protein
MIGDYAQTLNEMDTPIRNHFPRLIDLWLPISPLRVTQWFTCLCPRKIRDMRVPVTSMKNSGWYTDSKTWFTILGSTLLTRINDLSRASMLYRRTLEKKAISFHLKLKLSHVR